jgi:alpha-methylacyl-CoA racemase
MVLSDLGAEMIRLDRPQSGVPEALPNEHNPLLRGRRALALDLRDPKAVAALLRLIERADAVIEGFRPGVAERLGVGPRECFELNPALVYGRITGWGQDGPLAAAAGPDIDYIALTGVLNAIGPAGGPPVPPMNLVGDFGGGGMLLALGVVCALLEARSSGRGQVVDAAMVDGASLLATLIHGLSAVGGWLPQRGTNLLDGGAPFSGVYETSDGGHIAVGALEPQFYAPLVQRLGLADAGLPDQMDRERWPEMRERFAQVFRSRTRTEWCDLLEGTDACFAPVLSFAEAALHPHNRSRGTFVQVAGVVQPAPAPRFSRTPGAVQGPPRPVGADTAMILAEAGCSAADIAALTQGPRAN